MGIRARLRTVVTPTDRKIEIMNRTYATVVHKLTNEIIDLKMKQEPTIDTEIIIPEEIYSDFTSQLHRIELRKVENDKNVYKAICAGLSVTVIGLFLLIAAIIG